MNNSVQVSDALTRKIILRIAPLMVIMYVFNQFQRANVGYAALTMNQELGLTAAQFGLATSFFYIGYILFEVPSNLIMHRIGARIWIARILFTWGLASSLTGLVPNKEWLWGARFILGVFEAGLFPGMVFYMTLWLPTRNRVMLMSMFVMAIPITGTLGAPISTLIMQHVSIFDLSGWRSMLILEGLPAVLLGFVVLAVFPDSPAKAKWLTPNELKEVESALAAEKAQVAASDRQASVMSVLTNGKVWALGAVYFAVNAGIIGLLYFLPQVVKGMESLYSTKFSIVQVGMISAIPFSVSIVAVFVWAKFMSKRQVSGKHVALPMTICAAALSSALYMPNIVASLAVFAVGTSACFSTMVTFWQLPSRFLTGRAAAAGIAFITSIGVTAGVAMPYAIGYLKDQSGGYSAAFTSIAVCMIVAAAVVVMLESRNRAIPAGAAARY
jgi:ACS family tartrate transporter-like MFS transporter